MGLPHFEAKELACYYFMSADRIDETPGSESKDLLFMAEEAGWIWASWIQFLMARKPHVVMLWGSDGWLLTQWVALQLRNKPEGFTVLQQAISKHTFCPRERYCLISKGCWMQTELWEMVQVKCSEGPAFWAYPARCVEVQESHGGLSFPTGSSIDFKLSWLLANLHKHVQLHWLLYVTWLTEAGTKSV